MNDAARDTRKLTALRKARGLVPAVVYFGVRGSGKTSALRHRIRSSVARSDWLIADPGAEFDPSDFGGRGTIMQTTAEMYKLSRPKPGWAYIFRNATNEEVAALAMDMGNVAVAFDEGDSDFRGFVDEDSACWAVFNKSRQFFVAPYLLARRPTDVMKGGRCNASHAVFTFCADEDDLDAIHRLCQVPGVAEEVMRLPHPRWEVGQKTRADRAIPNRHDGVFVVECTIGLDFAVYFIPHKGLEKVQVS